MNDRFMFRVFSKNINGYIIGTMLVGDSGKMIYDVAYDCCNTNQGDYIIEQCTGLKDKNGKLIYEGDIVRCSNGNIYNICWSDTAMIMIAVNTTTKIGDAIYKLKCYDEFEIIGNIHEQAEQKDIK